MKTSFKSILGSVAVEVNNSTKEQFGEMKMLVFSRIAASKIKIEAKKQMLDNVFELDSLQELQKYICNSLLYFEGMSVNRYKVKC